MAEVQADIQFEKGKQASVLAMNTAAFTVNFAVWTMFSVIGIKIKSELGLNETEFGLLISTPILTGSLVRLPLGLLTDRYGGRIVYFIQMILVAVATYGMHFATKLWQYQVIGLCVGLAGGSFAIGIAYTSAWFNKKSQGTALGIFGAGNVGAALNIFIAPLIIIAWGWREVPTIYSITMLVMAVIFWFFTYPDPQLERRKREGKIPTVTDMLAPLREPRVWRYGLAYYFAFGGFVALSLWLPKYYMAEYGLGLTTAAFISLFFVLPSGVIRALGGWFSDKWGGSTVTWWVFWVSLVALFFLSYPPTTFVIHGIKGDVTLNISVSVTLFTILVFIVGTSLGIGTASVYRSLADHYSENMGSAGGMVGVIGGLGGFTLPIMFGVAADATGVRSSAFMLMYAVLGGVMIWTWRAAKSEREDILEQDPAFRDKLVEHDLLHSGQGRRHWLQHWQPNNEAFWRSTGRRVAMRNLLLSMPALLLSFTVWMVWSVVVVELPKIGFRFTTSELFWLAAAPGISGVFFRLLYSFVVPLFGGRNWTIFSTASLLIPTLWMAFAVQDPGTDYTVFVVIALLCGLGGGNFASSMASISFFFPKRLQGTALGWNAGVGNLGVGIVQGVVPLVVYGGALFIMGGDAQTYAGQGGSGEIWLQNAGFIWVPFILLATVAAAWGQDNIRGVRATLGRQFMIYRRKHAWLLTWLYAGTFGSFIGFSAAFPILLATLFPDTGMVKWAFIGPLAAALVRPLGGWLSDRLGGARVALWNFAAMAAAAFGVLMCLPSTTGAVGAAGGSELPWFFAAFMVLFITTGIGNGAVFHMVPTVFMGLHKRLAEGMDQAAQDAAAVAGEIEASVALGFTSAIAALGLFYIPALIAVSMDAMGSPQGAMITLIIFYVTCLFATWWWYRRQGAPARCDQ